MAFKPVNRTSVKYESPEALFNDCKKRKYPGLLSHQADVLRKYQQDALERLDVAFQMPTGSGKTLVGVLLAEWRRRSFNNRPLYLAPTKQLAYQVANEAKDKYDIKVVPLVGPKASFPAQDRAAWQGGEVVVVTTFSGLFNINPEFSDPDIIIVDDAHAAENYFADHWSVTVVKKDTPVLWQALATLLKDHLHPLDHKRLITNPQWPADLAWVDKLPTPALAEAANAIGAIFDEHLKRDDPNTRDAWFAWGSIRGQLLACHLYVSATEISLRPLIAPTFSHAPFAGAKQRVYMSATLGQGGELERLTGRREIHRIPVPPAWEKQGLGRRFFMFPSRSMNEAQELDLLPRLMRYAPRRTVLSPSTRRADQMARLVRQKLGADVFDATQIEKDKAPFVKSTNGVAVLANRYDGIDFSDDDCRLLVVDGMPKAVNLQERFIMSRMGAAILLNDRMMTRIVQAFGRCTRSATDYSAVVVTGDDVMNLLMRRDKRALLHPELQAEIEFGLEQSANAKGRDFEEYLELFLKQGEEWSEAGEASIQSLRSDAKQFGVEAASELESGVRAEVEYQELMWVGDYEGAMAKARLVLTNLKSHSLRGYRCLWNYLAGSAAYLATHVNGRNLDDVSKDFYWGAGKESSGISWLKMLARYTGSKNEEEKKSPRDDALIERMESFIERVGTSSDGKLIQIEKTIREGLGQGKKSLFESAHVELGRLLGYDAGNKETPGAPDPWWIVDDKLCLIFEDHSDATSHALDVTKARQVSSHPKWARDNLDMAEGAEIIPVLVSPVTEADTDALPHLDGVAYWPLAEFRQWAELAIAAFREARNAYPGHAGDLVWREECRAALARAGVDLDHLLSKLRRNDAKKLLQPKK